MSEIEHARRGHPVWDEIKEFFSPAEFERVGSDPYEMDVAALRLFYRIRRRSGVPFRILEGTRGVGAAHGVANSEHHERPAAVVDIQINNASERGRILRAAYLEGVRRVGIYPGKDMRSENPEWRDRGGLHLGLSRSPRWPDDVAWTRF
jgi:hypothetical protein